MGLLLLVVRAAIARDSQPRQHGPLLGTCDTVVPPTSPSLALLLPPLARARVFLGWAPQEAWEKAKRGQITEVGAPGGGMPDAGTGAASGHQGSDPNPSAAFCSQQFSCLTSWRLKWGSVGTSGTP